MHLCSICVKNVQLCAFRTAAVQKGLSKSSKKHVKPATIKISYVTTRLRPAATFAEM
jgi:hypothetical protein